jgi:DNA-binding response OmpR family regulator/predicted regulator of Ras-like GTPase activity (Roadblock/LC7/MglB family)
MTDVWRIFVVEDDENLNQNIVNALRKDGYVVQSVSNGADAVRVLWSEEYDVVIGDLKTPGAGGFELLQWLRAYRPNTYMILIGDAPLQQVQTRALESGAASYLEMPLDLRFLKEELRRLLQQTGFSADLDSFDLLDIIQMITISRRSIALLVNTGLEERGLLRFQNGELIWAEYGTLRGEEAFFALAAHKNGSVVQQPWNGGGTTNVTQPLSRLIFQALQYRTKYANVQDYSVEQEDVTGAFSLDDIDDSPFGFVEESANPVPAPFVSQQASGTQEAINQDAANDSRIQTREWWENTGRITSVPANQSNNAALMQPSDVSALALNRLSPVSGELGPTIPPPVQKSPAQNAPPLPSWLTDQPTASGLPVIRTDDVAAPSKNVPNTPTFVPSSSPEWRLSPSATDAVDMSPPKRYADVERNAAQTSGEWALQSMARQSRDQEVYALPESDVRARTGSQPEVERGDSLQELQQLALQDYNYPALVSALQTLGYSIPGFIAAAVVSMDGQPIAQVAVEDVDIAQVCRSLSSTLRGIAQMLTQEGWGGCEQMTVSSAARHVLVGLVGETGNAFQVLITAREADLAECRQIMANVEGAIAAALT